MTQLIDSSTLITLERRGQWAVDLDSITLDQPSVVATITVSELLAGAHRANSAERRQQREALVDKVLEVVPVLDFDLRVARTHAWVIAQLAAKGQLIGAHDMLIAATALTHGYEILTENLNDFQRVPGLVVRQPRW